MDYGNVILEVLGCEDLDVRSAVDDMLGVCSSKEIAQNVFLTLDYCASMALLGGYSALARFLDKSARVAYDMSVGLVPLRTPVCGVAKFLKLKRKQVCCY